jgi:hypothetical protein
MEGFHIQVDRRQLDEAAGMLRDVKGGLQRVTIRALRRTVNAGRTDISKAVGQELNLRKRDIDPRITSKLNLSDTTPNGILTIKRKPVPLIKYLRGVTASSFRKRKGVSVTVLKKEGRKTLPGTFIMASRYSWAKEGQFAVAERQLRGRSGALRYPRLPLQTRFGATVLGRFIGAMGILTDFGQVKIRDLGAVFTRRLIHETKYELARIAARRRARG